MPIEVQHQPVDAMYELAQQAGYAQNEQKRQEQRDRIELQGLQQQHQKAQAAFMARAQEQARAEETQYQMMLIQAKRQIDMQTEMSDYAMQKQKLQQTLNMIGDSNDFSEAEKEELSVQAMAKYAGVGTGISPSSFGGGASSTAMKNFLMKGAFRSKMSGQLQSQIDSGYLNEDAAMQMASDYGIDFTSTKQGEAQTLDEAIKRAKSAKDLLDNSFDTTKKDKIVDKVTGREIEEDSPDYQHYLILKREEKAAVSELRKLQGERVSSGYEPEFSKLAQTDPKIQQALQLYDPEKVYEMWLKEEKGVELDSEGFEKDKKKSGLLNKIIQGGKQVHRFSPAGAIYDSAKKMTGG